MSAIGRESVRHTHDVIQKLSDLLSATQDIEAGYRGFGLVGDPLLLGPYQAGLLAARENLSAVTASTTVHPEQQASVEALRTLIAQKVQFGAEVVALRQKAGAEAASAHLASRDTIRSNETIRNLIHDIRDFERRLLADRQTVTDRDFTQLTTLLTLGIVAALLTLVIAGWLVGRDTLARWTSEQALRTAEARTTFALKAAGVGIWDLNYTTGSLLWSETLEAQYGLLPGTFAGTFEAFMERVHPEDRADLVGTVNQASKSGAPFTLLYRAIWLDGTVRWHSSVGRFDIGKGDPIRAVGIVLDITERRALEVQFQQAQKMDAVGQLAGGIAHDFNNLLTVILGFSELVLDAGGPDDPNRPDVLEIQTAGRRAQGLTRQLLAFSRKQVIQPARLDLNLVVGGMRAMLGRLIKGDVTIVVDIAPGLASVNADHGQVEQVLMNLVVNAGDAMPKGGRLTIATANVNLDQHHSTSHFSVVPGPYVSLTVTDTGTGMSAETQSRLFEAFYTTKAAGTGTGLGLATIHSIVKQCGGSVMVKSSVGQGTSVSVYFPRMEDVTAGATEPPAPTRQHWGTETVLVVDDSSGLRDLTRRLLERQGYRVLVAADAEAAVALFSSEKTIDVLLTDVVMPGGSGPKLAQQLTTSAPGLRVIYMSGYTDDAIVHHGVLKSGVAFLHKPFTSDALGQKLREAMNR
ncbi:MAG: CHASE3 domain-containing protein [Acidobacteriota bacterium]|nr:CHASE3 domain-containing protein [Acidobacteriota bacterium]